MRFALCCCWLPCLVASLASGAEEKFDPAARAKAIAPFIDEQTIVIAHADLTRIKTGAVFAQLAKWLSDFPEAQGQLQVAQVAAAIALQSFATAGGREAYLVVSVADVPQQPPFVIVPLAEGANEKLLASLFAPAGYEVTERLGKVLFLGNRPTLDRLKQLKPDPRPELLPAFAAAGDTAAQVLLLPPGYSRRVIEEIMPTFPAAVGGGSSTILTQGLLWAAVGIDPPPHTALRLTVQSKDSRAAAALRQKYLEICRVAGEEEDVLREVPRFKEMVPLLTPELSSRHFTSPAEADQLVLVLDEQNKGVENLWSLLGPAMAGARDSAKRVQSANALRQLSMAMMIYEQQHGRLPAAASHDAKGKPLLSWRVHLLPMLGQEDLYKQFKLDEPWDSVHNRTLIEKMPPIYRSPGSKLAEKGRTNYVVPVGKDTAFAGQEGTPLKDIKNPGGTILVVEVNDAQAVVWTKPEDLNVNPEKPHQGLGGLYEGGFNAAFCDGHVEFVSSKTEPQKLRAMFSAKGDAAAPPR